jgi:hypothetical protein
MGHSIVYCDRCGQLLKEEDFRQGRAFTADNRSTCAGCRPAGSTAALPAQPPGPRVSSTRIPKQPHHESISSTRIPKQPQHESISSTRIPKQPQHDSRRIVAQPQTLAPPPPETGGGSGSRVALIGVGVGVAALIGIFAMFSGTTRETRKTEDSTSTQSVVSVKTAPVENLTPQHRRLDDAARAACVKAYEVQTTQPKDFAAQWRAFEAALAASQGTTYVGEADAQLKKIRRQFDEERSGLESRAQDLLSKEQFRKALEVWEGEVKHYDVAEWTGAVNQRITDLKADFERRIGVMRETAAEAKRRGDEAEAKRVRARVAGWGIPGYAEQIDQALAEAVVVKVEKTPDNAGPTGAVETYRNRWKEIVAPAAARDCAELLKAMEKLAAETKDDAAKKEAADDLENLRLGASVFQEAGALLPRMAKGQKIALAYWDAAGNLARVEEVILRIDAQRVEVKLGDGSVVIPFGEVAAATLADLFKARAAKKESDARAAAAACFLDGDAEGAQKFRPNPSPMFNDKYGEAAKELLRRRSGDEKEKAARQLFTEAERDFFDYGEMAGAVAKYKSLLGGEHAATGFVRRTRAAIAARAEGGIKDFLFASGDLSITSGFKAGKYGKIEAAWVSQQDLDPAKAKDNYVEMEFSAAPESEYRCWILAGGCCQEVFTFHYQGTEQTGPDPANPKEKIAVEPGGASGALVKSAQSSLKKLHSMHNGPKNPERFEWVLVGTFKFPTAGAKRIRILSNQKGFAVAGAAVLGTRPGPPRELEFKEFEKWRAETPGASLKQGGVVTGGILREVWKDIGGASIGDLVNNPAFKEDRPTEHGIITVFEGPTDWADNYGTRIRGYVHPPVSGAYIFWIATDDQGELWLSSDEDPAHKEKIGSVPDFTLPREYGKHASQQSKPIELKAGRRYYIEALQKEGGGGDNISVKWQLPNGTQEMPIPGNRLSPFVPVKK